MRNTLISALVLCAASLHAAQPIKSSLATNQPGCEGPRKVVIAFRVEKPAEFTPDVQGRLVDLWKWFGAFSPESHIRSRIQSASRGCRARNHSCGQRGSAHWRP